jgi:hypothetical protein
MHASIRRRSSWPHGRLVAAKAPSVSALKVRPAGAAGHCTVPPAGAVQARGLDRLREAGALRRADGIGALSGDMAFILAWGSPLAKRLPSPALTARRLAATLKAGGEGFAYMRYSAGRWDTRPQRCCRIISDQIACAHRRPSARPSQAPPPATAPRTTAPARDTHYPCTAGVRKHPRTAQAQPMHAAYR